MSTRRGEEGATLRLWFEVDLTRRRVGAGVLLLAMLGSVAELGSEQYAMTTYYPSPSGIYWNMTTTGAAYLSAPATAANASENVGIGTTNVTHKLHTRGSLRVSGDTAAPATRGYLFIDAANSGCSAQTVSANSVICSATEYASFSPGLYIEDFTYQNRGGRAYADAPGGAYQTTQVWGLNTNPPGTASWMTLKADNSEPYLVYCCPRS